MSGFLFNDLVEFFTRPWLLAGLVFFAIGAILLSPLILRNSSRKRYSELLSYDGLMMVGLGVLGLIWVGFFVYNRLVAH